MKRVTVPRKQKSIKDTSPLGQMRSLIEELTHSGQKELNGQLMSSLRNICKQSDDYVGRSYQMVMHQLQKDHAEVRYPAFLIIDDFFRRSHTFRELLLNDMQQYMELTIGVNEDNPLPPPCNTAKSLKKRALHAIHEWNQKYGSAYKTLNLAYKYLQNCFKVDFGELAFQSSIEYQRQLEQERRRQELLEAKSKKILEEVKENEEDIRQTLTALENCLSLLLPHPKDFFLDIDDGKDVKPSNVETKGSSEFGKVENVKSEDALEAPSTSNVINSNEQGENEKPEIITPGKSGLQNDEESIESESDDCLLSSSSDSEEELVENINMREYGVLNPHASITIDLQPKPDSFQVTEENSVVAENARDLYIILTNRHLNDIKKWIQILTKTSHAEKIKSLISLKNSIESVASKYQELNLPAKKLIVHDSDDSDTSDLEEVKPKEDFEEKAIEPLPSTSQGTGCEYARINKAAKKGDAKHDWSIISPENNPQDPTSVLSTVSKIVTEKMKKEKKIVGGEPDVDSRLSKQSRVDSSVRESIAAVASTSKESRKSKLLAVAPKVPFDLDLYHWENEEVPSSVMRTSHPDAHNIWSTASLDTDDPEIPKELSGTVRVIEFSGKFTPVKWACRAPLPSGKLCPRKDRDKCPFHGPIVPRDEQGNVCEVNGKLPQLLPEKPKVPDWQDPELLRDIERQTGIDLTIPEKGKRKKNTKHSALTDIKAAQNTAYNRLAKKIFKKSTMKRVASTLDAIDHKKFRDKFGDQFNYS